MGHRQTFWLAEAFREGFCVPRTLPLVLLLTVLIGTTYASSGFIIDSKFGQECTQQLQCGTKGLVCLDGICQYVFSILIAFNCSFPSWFHRRQCCSLDYFAYIRSAMSLLHLLTISGFGISSDRYCSNDTQCQKNVQSLYQCNTKLINNSALWEAAPNSTSEYQIYGLCTHKALFGPLHWKDILTTLICFVGSCVAAGAGVGGGGLNVAMLVFINGFTATSAIPLSSVCMDYYHSLDILLY
jgi:hypothetical protein